MNIVKENFRKIPKEEKLSADEQIISFKGRSIMKQYMAQKPNRWVYKIFLLAGANSGICYAFIFLLAKVAKWNIPLGQTTRHMFRHFHPYFLITNVNDLKLYVCVG